MRRNRWTLLGCLPMGDDYGEVYRWVATIGGRVVHRETSRGGRRVRYYIGPHQYRRLRDAVAAPQA